MSPKKNFFYKITIWDDDKVFKFEQKKKFDMYTAISLRFIHGEKLLYEGVTNQTIHNISRLEFNAMSLNSFFYTKKIRQNKLSKLKISDPERKLKWA